MNKKTLTVSLMICIAIIACAVYITVLSNNKETNNTKEDVVLAIKENTITNTGLTLIIKNPTSNAYCYYPYNGYSLEKFDGSWCEVSYTKEYKNILENGCTLTMPHTLKAHDTVEEEIMGSNLWRTNPGVLSYHQLFFG
jgi:hypothetical protein